LGNSNDLLTPLVIAGLDGNLDMSINTQFMCQIRPDASVQCAGSGFNGRLGTGNTDSSQVFVDVITVENAIAVNTSPNHSCALIEGGTMKCWGSNFSGQLGTGSDSPSSLSTPVDVVGINSATAIAMGDSSTCALLENKTIRCWGSNVSGQVGNGSDTSTFNIPQYVIGINTAIAIDAGRNQACAILIDETVRCWGSNGNGQLGNQDPALQESNVPVLVKDITGVTNIGLGEEYICTLSGFGSARVMQCLGDNNQGQLATTSYATALVPTSTTGITKTLQQIVGGSGHSCALYTDGTIDCWGRNFVGELGIGSLEHRTTPTAVPGISTAVSIGAGRFSTCAVLTDGTVKCWGGNGGGLGNNSSEDSTSPVVVQGISTATAVAVGNGHICALLSGVTDNTIECWGDNSQGQLGDSSNVSSLVPVAVTGITTAEKVVTGSNHSCALLADATMQCWGQDIRDQLGRGGSADPNNAPAAVINISNITDIGAGSGHTCAVINNDTVQCWGFNSIGQLGNVSSISSSDTPLPVAGASDVTALAVLGDGVCVTTDDGNNPKLLCWGENRNGQLGVNDPVIGESFSPVEVSMLDTADLLGAGDSHICAVNLSSDIQCWGDNFYGAIGNGTRGFSITPNLVDVDL